MKIRINVEEFKKNVADMEPILKYNPLIIMDYLYIKAENNVISVIANDLNIAVTKHISGEVIIEGTGLLHLGDLSAIYRLRGDIVLEIDDKQCVIRSNRLFKFDINEKADDFLLPQAAAEDNPNFTIAENNLLYCLKLKKIISREPGRGYFRGIWIDKCNLLACDGCRLGKIKTDSLALKSFMIPNYVIDYLAKALDKNSTFPVTFHLAENGRIIVRSERFEILYKQYDGEFIRYDEMFDLSNAEIVDIPKQDLVNTIGFMCDVYKTSYKGKRKPQEAVIYSFYDKKLKLAFSTDCKRVEEVIAVENLGSYVDFEIAFQPIYVYELLSLIEGDKIFMSFEKPFTPSIIYGEKENEMYLMLPLNTKKAA